MRRTGVATPLDPEWLQHYEEQQETELKRFIAGPSGTEDSAGDDDEETDLKKHSKTHA